MLQRLPRLPIDTFLLALLAVVALAAVVPASGAYADALSVTTKVAIALLFFLYGARLSPTEAWHGLRHWRLHLLVLAATFVAFPLLGLAARALVPSVLTPGLYTGVLFLCLVPSTVQSSIAFTSIAHGNVPSGDRERVAVQHARRGTHPAAGRAADAHRRRTADRRVGGRSTSCCSCCCRSSAVSCCARGWPR